MENDVIKNWYNTVIPDRDSGGAYEHDRWFKNPIQEVGYELTKSALEFHVLGDETEKPLRILELGPGVGTWTKFLLKRFPDTYIDLLDISKEMLARAKEALPKDTRIRFIESDILTWNPEGEYDLFFSSRVLEYINDKKAFAEKLSKIIPSEGRGFVITKMPHYERERFLGRKSSQFHEGQIAPAALRDTLIAAGFIDVDCYPVTISIPLIHSARLNLFVGRILGQWPLGLLGMFLAESYCVLFRKP